MAFDILTVNGVEYELICNYSFDEKMQNNNDPAIKLSLHIKRLSDNYIIPWGEFKGSYLSEKVAQYIKNTVNGQRTFYWKSEK